MMLASHDSIQLALACTENDLRAHALFLRNMHMRYTNWYRRIPVVKVARDAPLSGGARIFANGIVVLLFLS